MILCSASASTMSGWIAKSENEATGAGSVTVAAAVSASAASALRSSGVVVASVTSVMGLFRSAGARAPAQGLWADRRSSGGGLRRGLRALATSRNWGHRADRAPWDTRHSTVRLASHGAHLDRGPDLPRSGGRPPGRPRLRRADRVHPDGRRLRPRADAVAEVVDGGPGQHRVRAVLRARRAHALARHRPGCRDGAVRGAVRLVPRAHEAQGLARGAGQGLRGRRHRQGLLPRDVAVRRRRHPRRDGPGARRRRRESTSSSGSCATP